MMCETTPEFNDASRGGPESPWLVLRGGDWEATQRYGPNLRLDDDPIRRLVPDPLADETSVADIVARLRAVDRSGP